jgi:hypothetical protein
MPIAAAMPPPIIVGMAAPPVEEDEAAVAPAEVPAAEVAPAEVSAALVLIAVELEYGPRTEVPLAFKLAPTVAGMIEPVLEGTAAEA